jgi:anti-sigma B factor antagonist
MSPKRFPATGPELRPRSLTVTGRSRRFGEYAREAVSSVCQIDLALDGDASVVTVTGQLDITCGDRFIGCLREVRDAEPATLAVDLREVTFIDSTGLSLLLKADALARQNGFELQIVRSDAQIVRAVMEATGVERFLPLVDDVRPAAE